MTRFRVSATGSTGIAAARFAGRGDDTLHERRVCRRARCVVHEHQRVASDACACEGLEPGPHGFGPGLPAPRDEAAAGSPWRKALRKR